jgi:nucleoside-diphosphate-sugar epimerase
MIPLGEDGQQVLAGVEKIVVTGASGFVGRHLVERLKELGKEVVAVSRSSGIDVIHNSLPLKGVGHVFHLAARTGVVRAWQDPLGFLETNTFGTARVLEQCRVGACPITFVSAYVYGVPSRVPIRETDRVDANNPYALSKHLAEQVCTFYARFYGLHVVTLRLFNIYGPGQEREFLIPSIVDQVLDEGRPEIEVKDLDPSRDYVYVSDAVEGILAAAGAATGSIFNLGSGVAHSVEEIIKRVSAAAGIVKPYRATGEKRTNEIDRTAADVSALRSAVGWEPRVSIDDGLRCVIEGMRKP